MENEKLQISELLHPRKPNRQAQLKAWMMTYGIEAGALAKVAGVSPQMMSMIIAGSRAPRGRIERLVFAGVPRDLLPEPTDGKCKEARPLSFRLRSHVSMSDRTGPSR